LNEILKEVKEEVHEDNYFMKKTENSFMMKSQEELGLRKETSE
jgi:hypothetical protein